MTSSRPEETLLVSTQALLLELSAQHRSQHVHADLLIHIRCCPRGHVLRTVIR